MMKKLLLAAIGISLVLGMAPADAKRNKVLRARNVSFSAVACTVVCPWWTNTAALPNENVDPAKYDPTAVALADIDTGCTHPSPEASYDDVRVRAPKGAKWLTFKAWPEMDWDIFVCRPARGPGDRFVAYSANSIGPDEVDPTQGMNEEQILCFAGVGCDESVTVKVRAGRIYILRAFNWGDVNDLPARYIFTR